MQMTKMFSIFIVFLCVVQQHAGTKSHKKCLIFMRESQYLQRGHDHPSACYWEVQSVQQERPGGSLGLHEYSDKYQA